MVFTCTFNRQFSVLLTLLLSLLCERCSADVLLMTEGSRKSVYDDVRVLLGAEAGTADGPAYVARFTNPLGIAAGPNGSFLVTDYGNHALRLVTPTAYDRSYRDIRTAYTSCAEIALLDPRTVDGYFTIYYQANLSKPIRVWCANMGLAKFHPNGAPTEFGAPKDYLDVNPSTNYATYNCEGTLTTGVDIVTTFSRIRLNTTSSKIMLDDWTFSTSTGNCTYMVHGVAEHVLYNSTNPNNCDNTGGLCGQRKLRYGFAGGCWGGGDTRGVAMIDLRGTAFAVHKNSTWTAVGYMPESVLHDMTNDVSWVASKRTSLELSKILPFEGGGLARADGLPTSYFTRTMSDAIAQHYTSHEHLYGPTYQVRINGGGACGWTHLVDDEFDDFIVTETHRCTGDLCTGLGHVRGAYDNHGLVLSYQQADETLVVPPTPIDYNVTTLVGNPGVSGQGKDARFQNPCGVVYDIQSSHSTEPDIYVADYGNQVIRRVSLNGTVTVHLGQVGVWNSTVISGTSVNVRLCEPYGLALDGSGNLYFSEYCGHKIRVLSSNGDVSLVAGSSAGWTDGTGGSAQFRGPKGIALFASDTVLFVADTKNHLIRRIHLLTLDVTTLAGIVGQAGYVSGIALQARFEFPTDLVVGPDALYVSEVGRVRVIYFNDTVVTIVPCAAAELPIDGTNGTMNISNYTNGSNSSSSSPEAACHPEVYKGPVVYLFAGPVRNSLAVGDAQGVNSVATLKR